MEECRCKCMCGGTVQCCGHFDFSKGNNLYIYLEIQSKYLTICRHEQTHTCFHTHTFMTNADYDDDNNENDDDGKSDKEFNF